MEFLDVDGLLHLYTLRRLLFWETLYHLHLLPRPLLGLPPELFRLLTGLGILHLLDLLSVIPFVTMVGLQSFLILHILLNPPILIYRLLLLPAIYPLPRFLLLLLLINLALLYIITTTINQLRALILLAIRNIHLHSLLRVRSLPPLTKLPLYYRLLKLNFLRSLPLISSFQIPLLLILLLLHYCEVIVNS